MIKIKKYTVDIYRILHECRHSHEYIFFLLVVEFYSI